MNEKMKQINVNVFIERENKKVKIGLGENSTASDLLALLRLNPVTVIVARNSELVLENERLKNGDEIKILSVISGG